ncbi:MAG: multiheme c-type cytochrome, partial [Pseudomonadales bacterium]|nr:multiheme c-type cytochrome [Pseudomonadales bacterium]
MIRIRTYLLCLSVVCLSWMRGVEAEQLPQYAPQDHLGVATCASGVCHGSVRAREATAVSQNEYVIWSRRDRHRAAYNTLLTDQSKSIAKNLGLKNAHEADMCLDCHADNVAVENRGERFQISDGVGCEACHGGSETYISTHVDDAATHASNIEDGLYPSDDPRARAKLCLSCHLGTSEKMASHNIMGAGHPRISFELDTFNWLQPAHYNLDEDYRAEKWAGSSLELWTIGQVEAARQTLG